MAIRPRASFGPPALIVRDPKAILMDPDPMRSAEFDSLPEPLRLILHDYPEPDVKAMVAFLGSCDPEVLEKCLVKQSALRISTMLKCVDKTNG